MPQKSGKSKSAPNKQEKSGTTAKKQKKATPAPEPQRTVPSVFTTTLHILPNNVLSITAQIGDSWELSVVNAKTTTAFQNSTGKSVFPITTIKVLSSTSISSRSVTGFLGVVQQDRRLRPKVREGLPLLDAKGNRSHVGRPEKYTRRASPIYLCQPTDSVRLFFF